jgi:hypothetical protein
MSQYVYGDNSGDVTVWQCRFRTEDLRLTKNKTQNGLVKTSVRLIVQAAGRQSDRWQYGVS